MSNFKLIKKDIDISIFNAELNKYLEKYNWSGTRAERVPEQKNTKNIMLRNNFLKNPEEYSTQEEFTIALANSENNVLEKTNYKHFQKTYKYLEDFADEKKSQLSTVMIVSLGAKEKVYPHIDGGNYYKKRDRYHIPIKTKGSINICDGEVQEYKEGELWWFDNKKIHEAYNDSDEERIHIIFDILPKKRGVLKKIVDFLYKKLALNLS